MFGKKPEAVTEVVRNEAPQKATVSFAKWKGEVPAQMLQEFWKVSNGDKDFILTMAAENGSFNPYLKHPVQNRNGTWDYSFGLNSRYHWLMIEKIVAKQVSLNEIAQYHYNIYRNSYNNPKKTSCGKTAYCGYNRRNKKEIKALINFE